VVTPGPSTVTAASSKSGKSGFLRELTAKVV
jgi:hypothetical protein